MGGKFVVYILKNEKNCRYYTGMTTDLVRRIEHHNSPDAKWTKRYQPWRLIYVEQFETRSEALRREKFLKSKEGIEERLRILKAVESNP